MTEAYAALLMIAAAVFVGVSTVAWFYDRYADAHHCVMVALWCTATAAYVQAFLV